MILFTKQKHTHRFRDPNYGHRGKGGGRDSEGVWNGQVHTAIFKMGNQQGPTI